MIRQGFVGRCFASCTHLCYYESRMSALFFTGSLWAVHPGTIAIGRQSKRPVRYMRTLQRPYLQAFTLSR